MVVDVRSTATSQEKEVDAGPGIFPLPVDWQAVGFHGQGTVLPGQDLLWTGDFEPDVVGSTHAALWEMDNGVTITIGAAHAGRMGAGFRVKRGAKTASLTQTGRIPVQPGDSLTLTGMARGSGLSAVVRFFPDNKQASSSNAAQALPVKQAAKWARFAADLTVPDGATAAQLVVKLEGGKEPTQADLDEIRLIRWDKTSARMGMGTGFLRLDSPGKVALRTTRLPLLHTLKKHAQSVLRSTPVIDSERHMVDGIFAFFSR